MNRSRLPTTAGRRELTVLGAEGREGRSAMSPQPLTHSREGGIFNVVRLALSQSLPDIKSHIQQTFKDPVCPT